MRKRRVAMSDALVYYNPRCGTCLKVKALLEKKGYRLRLIEYLKTPPSLQELDDLLKKLKIGPEGLVRKKEPIYQEKIAGRNLTRAQWLDLFHKNPVLIERPIVVIGTRAVIARPPEALEALLTS